MSTDDKNLADTSLNDVKDSAQEKLDDLQERAATLKEESAEKLRNTHLTQNQKLVATGVAAVLVSTLVNKLWVRFRGLRIDNSVHVEEVVVVTPADVEDNVD